MRFYLLEIQYHMGTVELPGKGLWAQIEMWQPLRRSGHTLRMQASKALHPRLDRAWYFKVGEDAQHQYQHVASACEGRDGCNWIEVEGDDRVDLATIWVPWTPWRRLFHALKANVT